LGDILVVGANRRDDRTGVAYVFERSGTNWTQKTKLLASETATGNPFFGSSISVSGDTIVVGGLHNSNHVAYLFEKPTSGWASVARQSSTTTAMISLSEAGASSYTGNDRDNVGGQALE
jgi:hypothetical protein